MNKRESLQAFAEVVPPRIEGAAGRVQCMNKIGDDKSARTRKLCPTCRRIQDGYASKGPGIRSVKQSEYGEIRIRERKAGEK